MRPEMTTDRTVLLNEGVKIACDIVHTSCNDSDKASFAQQAMSRLPTQGRCTPVWMAAAVLAMTWASETAASPDQARLLADARQATTARNVGSDEFETLLLSLGSSDNSMQVAQATAGDTGAPQQSPERQHDWAGTLSCELTLARRDIELLQRLEQEFDRTERLEQDLAAARLDVEMQNAAAATAVEEASRLKEASRLNQAGESGAAELQQERERSAQLEQDLVAARRDVQTQTALATKAGEETSRLKQAGESGAAELQTSLQQERERSARLEQDLAAARRDVETQTALATNAGEETSRLKQAGESGAAELQTSLQQERDRTGQLEQALAAARRDIDAQTALAAKASDEVARLTEAAKAGAAEQRRSMQKEHERADTLAQDLSMARSKIYAYEAQAAKVSEDAAQLKQAEASYTANLEQSQQRERAEQLARDLAKASRDLDVQTERASKASEEVVRVKQAGERDSAELHSLLQRERERAEGLERDLALARHDNGAPVAKDRPAGSQLTTTGQVVREEPLSAPSAPARPIQNQPVQDKPVQDQTIAARSQGDAQVNPYEGVQAVKLVARASALLEQGNIGAARIVLERAAEMGSAQASFALAETYDPLVLPNFGTYGTQGDLTKAQNLYARAEAGGIKEAKGRLEALRR